MHFLQRIKGQRGAVALEAVFSMVFLFGIFFTMWGVARVINEQSRLDTGTQLATRAALQTYLRNAPAGCAGASGPCDAARAKAVTVAANVLALNVCGPGRLIGDVDQSNISSCLERLRLQEIGRIDGKLKIECSEKITSASWTDCPEAQADQSLAVRVRLVDVRYRSNWSLFTLIQGGDFQSESSGGSITASASAYSMADRAQ